MGLSVLSTGQPTYWPADGAKTPDLIDFCITKGFSTNYIMCESNLELSSDHTPILITLANEIVTKPRNCSLHSRKTDWHHFWELLKVSFNAGMSLKSEDDIEAAVEYFNFNMQNAA
ncbi:rna-directed dna polymerase from mobile element jockey-like protein [Lasius niger]|uniref:Rna-directed dna polymerase from mobile element jockey-like protein n=1 Tax=Lasius niger TaxID=67767 RepID=A0A0J7KFY2_LASNI|nr:rna-directed dna polymerase from mobile element jockey-like protein [Lasius niger]